MKAAPKKPKRAKPAPVQAPPPEPVPQAETRRPHRLLLSILFFVALLAWSNSFSAGFVFDNKVLITDARIKAVTPQNIDLIMNQEFWFPWSITGLYRPLATFSYLFNYAILGNGTHPAGYHWINFALHLANIALVYALGLLLFEELIPAFAFTALWALHPVLTESVTNIVGRSDLLAAFGVLAGLLCHIQAASARGWRKAAWLAGLAAAVAIGLFSKESAVVVVAVMLLYDVTLAKTSWGARVPGYAALALPMGIFFYIRGEVLANLPPVHVAFVDNPLMGADFWTARLTAVKVIGTYIGRLFWPLWLSPDYSYNQIPLVTWRFQTWEDAKALLALALCIGSLLLAVYCWRSGRRVFFFILFFFVTLAPTSNVFLLIGTIMAERFLYLPALAAAGLLVLAVSAICGRLAAGRPDLHLAAPVIFGVIALAFAVRTYARNSDWHDEKSFWRSGSRISSQSYKAHTAFAEALNDGSAAGLDQAIVEMDRALAILKDLPDTERPAVPYVNVGSYYRQKGDLLAVKNPDGTFTATPESLPWYRKSVETLIEGEKLEDAANAQAQREDAAAGRQRSFNYGVYQLDAELGHTYVRLREYPEALAAFERGRKLRAEPQFFVDIAGVWRAAGEPRKAAITLLEGLIVDASYPKFASGVVELYKQIDPKGCSIRGTGPAVSLNVDCPMVHDDICTAAGNVARNSRKSGHADDANRTVATAIQQLGCPAQMFQ